MIFVQYGEVDNLTNGGKNSSWSNCIIIVQICAVIYENVSGTKMCYFDNCERSEKCGGCQSRGVYQKGMWYTPRIAESLFRTTTSLLVYEALILV